MRTRLALASLVLFMLFSALALFIQDPFRSGAFVRICGHVVGARQLKHGCAYTVLSSGRTYVVLDFYRSCSSFNRETCFVGRPAGDDGNTVYRPLVG